MAGFVPAIHAFSRTKAVDARRKPGMTPVRRCKPAKLPRYPAVMTLTQPLGLNEPEPPSGEDTRVTPAMAQYVEIKAANPDCLLFYRMGDFYEMFFEDAEIASRALGIVLTKRGKYLGRDVPLCGVPVIRADEYLHRLIALGHRVAVCEQLEDPAEAKSAARKASCAATWCGWSPPVR